MIVLSHEPLRNSHIAMDLKSHAEAARQSGIRVHSLPTDIDDPQTALGWLSFDKPTLGILSTYIQRTKTYRPLYEAALERNIYLIHTPQQNSRLMEFELFYPLISDLTARSVVVKDDESLKTAQQELEFPVFTKGQIKSVKEAGWEACVAKTPQDLALRYQKWGEVIAREIMPLRKRGATGQKPFPEGREYRAFWLEGKIIGKEYYWKEKDPFGNLTRLEEMEVDSLIHEAASRLSSPLVTVDVGQLDDMTWRVIEIGDPQYSGIVHMSRYLFWQKMLDYEKTHTIDTSSVGSSS